MIQIKLDKKAKNVIAKTADFSGEGGTIVVDKLPKVGDEHTIYELRETSKGSYGWMFSRVYEFPYFLVFDTYEQMTSTINAIKIGENTLDEDYYAYIRNTNQMYYFYIEYTEAGEGPEDTGDAFWVFEEQQKKEDPSGTNYAFQLATFENYQTFYILKEFVGNEGYIPDGGNTYSYLTVDNKEVAIGYEGRGLLLKNIAYPNWNPVMSFLGYSADITSNTLPNSVELETNYYKLLRAHNGSIVCYNTSDNKYYELADNSTNYYWFNNQRDRENCYFAEWVEAETDMPPHYVGELEWTEQTFIEDLPKFDEIPYEQIINNSLDVSKGIWTFQPKKAGEVTSTYWIYTNDEWVNVDEMGEPQYFSVYIKSQHMRGLSIIPLDEVSFYMGEKELQLIKLTNDREQEFGCLLVPMTNEYDKTYSVTMKLTDEALSLFGGNVNLFINPTFVSVEDPISVRLDSSVNEYDFELLLGTLTLFNGNMM